MTYYGNSESLANPDSPPPPKEFNHSLLVFIRKAAAEGLEAGMALSAKELRSLSLGNTDAKTQASTLAVPLAKVAPSVISRVQEAYVKGRNLVRNVVRMEQHARRLTWAQLQACILLLDMAAAFPSVSRVFLFSGAQSDADTRMVDICS